MQYKTIVIRIIPNRPYRSLHLHVDVCFTSSNHPTHEISPIYNNKSLMTKLNSLQLLPKRGYDVGDSIIPIEKVQ